MHHLYISIVPDPEALQRERTGLVEWCRDNNVGRYAFLEENLEGRVTGRQINKLLRPVGQGDTVVASSLSRLGRSLTMVTSMLESILSRGASITCLDTGAVITDDQEGRAFLDSLRFAADLSARIRSERSNEALFAGRQAGRSHGRPAGSRRRPEKNVLYGKTETLEQLRSEGLSISEIARRLDVSRGTVSNYLSAHKS